MEDFQSRRIRQQRASTTSSLSCHLTSFVLDHSISGRISQVTSLYVVGHHLFRAGQKKSQICWGCDFTYTFRKNHTLLIKSVAKNYTKEFLFLFYLKILWRWDCPLKRIGSPSEWEEGVTDDQENPMGAPASSIDLIDHSRGNNRDKSAKTSPQHTPVSANIRVTIYLIILIMWSGESLCFHTSMTTPEWVYDLLRLRGHYNYYDTGIIY